MNIDTKESILITGASGFVGANLTRAFLERGAEVHVFLRKEPNWRLKDIAPSLNLHKVDLQDRDQVMRAVSKISPVYIFHCATYGGYPFQTDISEMFKTNVIGTINLFEALKPPSSPKRIINIGSSSEYGAKDQPMREDDKLEPSTHYGISKAAQSMLAKFYSEKEKLPVVTLRLLSVYGPFEEAGRLFTDIMLALHREGNLRLGSPSPKRDFIFVGDVIKAVEQVLGVSNIDGNIFNVGSGEETSVGDLVKMIEKLFPGRLRIEWGADEKKRSFETERWVADINKAGSLLGWEPRITLEEGIKKTYEWYTQNIHLYDSPRT